MPTQALSQLISRLDQEGYTDVCRTEDDGLHFMHGHAVYAPEDLQVDHVYRLEGTSAPDEQVVVFALRSPDDRFRGTFSSPHGVDVDPLDADLMQRLNAPADDDRPSMNEQSFQQQY